MRSSVVAIHHDMSNRTMTKYITKCFWIVSIITSICTIYCMQELFILFHMGIHIWLCIHLVWEQPVFLHIECHVNLVYSWNHLELKDINISVDMGSSYICSLLYICKLWKETYSMYIWHFIKRLAHLVDICCIQWHLFFGISLLIHFVATW